MVSLGFPEFSACHLFLEEELPGTLMRETYWIVLDPLYQGRVKVDDWFGSVKGMTTYLEIVPSTFNQL